MIVWMGCVTENVELCLHVTKSLFVLKEHEVKAFNLRDGMKVVSEPL